MAEAAQLIIRPIIDADRLWVQEFTTEQWPAPIVVSRGQVYRPNKLPGFLEERDGQRIGLLTFHVQEHGCQIVTLDSLIERIGIGSALIEAVHHRAAQSGCSRLWLITTNDNLPALRFYQKRGFHLVALHRDAMDTTRAIKPSLPRLGMDGIPLRDEIELELLLI